MIIPETYLLKFQAVEGKPRDERQELLSKFLTTLNASRAADGITLLTYPRLARMFTKVPTADLYPFYNDCVHAKSFSKKFWWSFKRKV